MMAFFPNKPAESDEIRLGAKQIRENFSAVVNDGIVVAKPPIYGKGTPQGSIGLNFECYLDTLTGNEYIKIDGAWILNLDLHEIYTVRDEFIEARSDIIAIHNDLANLAAEVAAINTNGSGGSYIATAPARYFIPRNINNVVDQEGSYYWKSAEGLVTVTSGFTLWKDTVAGEIHIATIPAGFRPARDYHEMIEGVPETGEYYTTSIKAPAVLYDEGSRVMHPAFVNVYSDSGSMGGPMSYAGYMYLNTAGITRVGTTRIRFCFSYYTE